MWISCFSSYSFNISFLFLLNSYIFTSNIHLISTIYFISYFCCHCIVTVIMKIPPVKDSRRHSILFDSILCNHWSLIKEQAEMPQSVGREVWFGREGRGLSLWLQRFTAHGDQSHYGRLWWFLSPRSSGSSGVCVCVLGVGEGGGKWGVGDGGCGQQPIGLQCSWVGDH